MTKKISLTYFGMDGEGATVREAKADAGQKLERLLDDLRDAPQVVVCGNWAKLVYRDRWGWCSTLIGQESVNRQRMILDGKEHGTSMGAASRYEAIASAAKHVASLAWSHDVPDDYEFARAALSPYLIAGRDLENACRELVEYWAWQRRYAKAREQGFDDNEAHHIAGGLHHLVRDYEQRAA